MIGQIVSHYKILKKLGEGGMGVVHKAEDTRLKRTVTLKFLPPDLTRYPDAKERFIHEAQPTATLQRNNICVVHDVDETLEGQIFISMEYLDGVTFKKKIERGTPEDQRGYRYVQPGCPASQQGPPTSTKCDLPRAIHSWATGTVERGHDH